MKFIKWMTLMLHSVQIHNMERSERENIWSRITVDCRVDMHDRGTHR